MYKKEFLVLAHNPLGGQSVSYAQVKLPNKGYQAFKFQNGEFQPVYTDIFEQAHFTQEGGSFTDYEMFIPYEIGANQIAVFRINKISDKQAEDTENQKQLAEKKED